MPAGEDLVADDEIEGDRTRRVPAGYDRLTEWLRAQLPPDAVQLNTVVRRVEWSAGEVVDGVGGGSGVRVKSRLPR